MFWIAIAGPLDDNANAFLLVLLIMLALIYAVEGIAILIGTLIRDLITGYVTGDSVISIFFVFE